MMGSCIYTGKVMHHRIRPKKHRFTYNIASWLIDLDELPLLDKKMRFFSWNRPNVVSFWDKDFADSSGNDIKSQVMKLVQQHDLPAPTMISLLCFPRILGYTFNPLSVYFCFADDRKLMCVVYEVSNTFGERHSYVIPCDKNHDIIRQVATKRMHVSPMMAMDCEYQFRLTKPGENLSLAIAVKDSLGSLFSAVLVGTKAQVSDTQVLKQALAIPFLTIKVIAAIHWEALRLWLKGLKIYPHSPATQPYQSSRGELQKTQQAMESKL